MPPAAILDIDGTLVDTNYQHALAWFRAFRQHDELLPIWRIHRHIGMGGDHLVEALCGEAVEEEKGEDIRSAEKALYLSLIEEVEPLQGARELIVDLKERGHAVVLASSAKENEVDHYLDLLDARDLADGWTTSADVEATKPEPDLVQAAVEKAGGGDAVMIGRLDLGLRGRRARRTRDRSRAHRRLLGGRAEGGRGGCGVPVDRRAAQSRSTTRRYGRQARHLPREARLREDLGAGRPPREEGDGAPLRGPGAPRAAACTGTCASSTTGALASWALPRGIPAHPDENRLAVHTEDHPLEYLEFEGEIPKGEYGAGTMSVWDRGTFDAEKFRDDEVIATFSGERMRGRYALFQTRGKDWMIHRMDPPLDPGYEPMPDRLHADAGASSGKLPRDDGEAGASRSSGTASAPSSSATTATCPCRAATSPTSRRAIPRCASWRASSAPGA